MCLSQLYYSTLYKVLSPTKQLLNWKIQWSDYNLKDENIPHNILQYFYGIYTITFALSEMTKHIKYNV